jgi:hypothetical protein
MAEFDYPKNHSRAMYAPADKGPVKKGQIFWCHAKEDEVAARNQGFTSTSYIKSEWPKSMFNKKTGDSRPVGKLEWDDAQNEAAVKALGADWTFDYVHPPKPEEKKEAGAVDLGGLALILNEIKGVQKSISDQGEAHEASAAELHAKIDELTGIVTAQDRRISELEAAATETK